MIAHTLIITFLINAFVGSVANAQSFQQGPLVRCGSERVSAVINGDQIKLANNNIINLDLILAPKLWHAESPYRSWPYAREAKTYLESLIHNRITNLYCDKKNRDFLSIQKSHLILQNDVWIQHEMVKSGHAILYPNSSSQYTTSDGYKTLKKLEKIARNKNKGLWALKSYQTIPADDINALSKRTGQFLFVQGRVLHAEAVGKIIYLNFGKNWQKDFTVEITTQTKRQFQKVNINPLTLLDKTIEVRGWVDYKAGPRLELLSPFHLNIISESR
jgi:endonuclease YncB( thermonuclease family)